MAIDRQLSWFISDLRVDSRNFHSACMSNPSIQQQLLLCPAAHHTPERRRLHRLGLPLMMPPTHSLSVRKLSSYSTPEEDHLLIPISRSDGIFNPIDDCRVLDMAVNSALDSRADWMRSQTCGLRRFLVMTNRIAEEEEGKKGRLGEQEHNREQRPTRSSISRYRQGRQFSWYEWNVASHSTRSKCLRKVQMSQC